MRFEPYIRVEYSKEYDEVLGDPIADIVEKETNEICTVTVNTEYDYYEGGSILVCSKKIDVDHDYLKNTRNTIEEVRKAAKKAEDVIEEAVRVLDDHFKHHYQDLAYGRAELR
ncbi:MAG: hypothetical protein GXO43_01265 [Crenarchaeota archaeon]|nr:hypothetical protein [Thermoproteota archaeon]